MEMLKSVPGGCKLAVSNRSNKLRELQTSREIAAVLTTSANLL